MNLITTFVIVMWTPSFFVGGIMGLSVAFLAIVMGLIVVASGQVPLVLREIALNIRKEVSSTLEQYKTLLTVAKVNNFLGWAIFSVGVLMGFWVLSLA